MEQMSDSLYAPSMQEIHLNSFTNKDLTDEEFATQLNQIDSVEQFSWNLPPPKLTDQSLFSLSQKVSSLVSLHIPCNLNKMTEGALVNVLQQAPLLQSLDVTSWDNLDTSFANTLAKHNALRRLNISYLL